MKASEASSYKYRASLRQAFLHSKQSGKLKAVFLKVVIFIPSKSFTMKALFGVNIKYKAIMGEQQASDQLKTINKQKNKDEHTDEGNHYYKVTIFALY